MAWNEAVVTAAGMELLAKSLTEGNMVITRAVGGESCSAALSLMALKGIREPCHELNLFKLENDGGKIVVNLRVQNKGILEEYTLRQIGLFAGLEGDGGSEVLFAVIQDGTGEIIPKESDNPEFLTEFDFVIPVSNAEKIQVEVSPGIFAAAEEIAEVREEIAEHTSDKSNPHGVTKAQVGLGNVPNLATNNQTPTYTAAGTLSELSSGEKLSAAFGKLAKAVKELISHIADNVRHITAAERTAWNGKAAGDHTHSNMTGATAAAAGTSGLVPAPSAGAGTLRSFLRGTGTWANPFHGADEAAGQDLNDITTGGVYFFLSGANSPANAPNTGAAWLLVLRNSVSYVKQIWFSLSSSKTYTRSRSNGTWLGWHQISYFEDTQLYLPLAGGTMTGTIHGTLDGNAATASQVNSAKIANWLTGNKGVGAAVNMTGEGNSYKCLAKLNSNNGVFTQGVLNDAYSLNYTTNDTIAEGKNTVNYQIRLLNESGNSIFPGNIKASSINLRNGITDRTVLSLYDDGDDVNNGGNLLVQGGGNTYIGSGESSNALYNAHTADTLVQGEQFSKTGERLYLASDLSIMFEVNCNIIANRKVNIMDVSGNFYPGVDNGSNLGLSANRWNNAYITTVHGNLDGNANTATKLGTANVGSAAQPIYLNGGTPAACTYTLEKSVPADAKFTDTTYLAATQSAAGLMSAADKKKLDGIEAGARGSLWHTGTLLTGTDTVQISGLTVISDARVGDMYLNKSTCNVYQCTEVTTPGIFEKDTVQKWEYVCCIKGDRGGTVAV